MGIEKNIENLKDYIRLDRENIVYDDSDFSKFCRSHCEDIEAVLNELEHKKEDIKINDVNRCEYCHEDFGGYYSPLDKNAHVCVFCTPHKKYLNINWYGHKMQIDINYCPICGRKL